MLVGTLGIRGKAAILLGAGATRGASLVRAISPGAVLPPLDADFFEQVQRITTKKHRDNLETLLEFKNYEFGPSPLRMESFFTQVEFLDILETKLRAARGPRPKYYRSHLETFKQVLAAVFEESLKDEKCEYHRRLVEALNVDDTILTFNYDCLVDETLRDWGGPLWKPSSGYGVRVYGGAKFWRTGPVATSGRTVRFLKLHGSMNWQRVGDGIRLKQRPYTKQHGGLHFEIIPPAWNKPVAEDPLYSKIWKQARIALAEASILVIAGYSLPPSDLLSQALLRISSEEGAKKKLLLLANPSQEVRDRIRNTIKASLNERTTIVELQRFDELVKVI